MEDRTKKYAKALDQLDQQRDAGEITGNEWEVHRTALLSEMNPDGGVAIGRFIYFLIFLVLLIVIVLLVVALLPL